jgi:ElaB/YqjD/DUF883 family membrane-anchored ribosome-binding protein
MGNREISEVADRLERTIARLEALINHTAASREEQYRKMLEETATILLSTKGSFRSRQLKQLRERIQSVLK